MAALTVDAVLSRSKAESIESVRSLQCWAMKLDDVNVLMQFPNLEVLNLSCNNITTLEQIGKCKSLCQLYLRKNKISHLEELEHLKNIPNLHSLWLSGNPISCVDNYRLKVLSLLPQLERLDEKVVTEQERKLCSSTIITSPEQDKVNTNDQQYHIMKAVLSLIPLLDQSSLLKLRDEINNQLKNSTTENY